MHDVIKVIPLKNISIGKYEGVNVLTCSITYPTFLSREFTRTAAVLNQHYQRSAIDFSAHCKSELYASAVADYQYDLQNGYPFPGYEAVRTFTVTYNYACTLSLYFDSYEYTGGAHGSTVRTSDTWNLQTARRYALEDFFPQGFDYKEYILAAIDAEIARQVAAGNDIYFPDAAELAEQSFNENSFYLNDRGIVIYFQQYDIAPYSSGILEFLIPYRPDTVMPPSCIEAISLH